MVELEKEIKKEEKKMARFFSNKSNIWMSVSILLVVVLILSLVFPLGMSKEKAGTTLVNFLNTEVVQGGGVTLKDVQDKGDIFLVNVLYQGQEIPVYLTKDGKYFIQSATPLTPATANTNTNTNTNTPAQTTVPKTDKPKVELYVWAYCPYGVLAQGPLAEVASLLKASADFEIVPYYDGHGAFETEQNKIQLCIQKNAKDSYWNYAAGFVKDIYPKCSATRDIACDANESIKLMKSLGIDSTKVMACVASEGDALFAAASAKAQQNGVSGSPTITINGVIASVARNSEAYKTAICNAFNNVPAECSNTLDSSTAAASGNCG